MPEVTPQLVFTQNINGTTGTITDATSDYGTGGKPTRNSRANFLLYSSNTEDGTRSYYLDVSTSLPLSQSVWNVTTDKQGWTQGTIFMIPIWSGSDSYIIEVKDGQDIITTFASIIYYTPTQKIYKCIQANTNIAPDSGSGSQYWQEVTDLTTLLGYESVFQFTEDFMVDFEINQCVTKGFLDNGCGCNSNLTDILPSLKNWALYFSATASFQNDSPDDMEKKITELEKVCSTCCK